MTRSFRPPRHHRKAVSTQNAEALVREARAAAVTRAQGYRERSLTLHGWICARCAREFESHNLHRLTVHHRDGNHNNNPPDGSNWENLCLDCHDAEHSRELLADYIGGKSE